MDKVQTMVLLNGELKSRAKRIGINLSHTLETALEYILQSQDQTALFDLQISKAKAQELQNQINQAQVQLNNELEKIQNFEENQKKMEIEQIKKAKEAAEKAKHCIKCGGVIEHKYHKFAAGNVCNGCFLVASKEDVKKWNTKIMEEE